MFWMSSSVRNSEGVLAGMGSEINLMAAASAANPPPSLLGAGVTTPARRPAIPWIVARESRLCSLQGAGVRTPARRPAIP